MTRPMPSKNAAIHPNSLGLGNMFHMLSASFSVTRPSRCVGDGTVRWLQHSERGNRILPYTLEFRCYEEPVLSILDATARAGMNPAKCDADLQ